MEPSLQLAAVTRLFDLVADEYDNVGVPFLGPIAEGLVAELGPRPGERAADLGCGRGEVAGLLAGAVRPGGQVAALDISPAMVAHTRALLSGAAGVDLDVRVADCRRPGLSPGSYQVVASSLVLFFLPDPWLALPRWVDLLAPGGRIGISTFGPSDRSWRAAEALLQPWMPPLDPRMTGAESPFASDAGMERALAEAGAVAVRTQTRRVEVGFAGVDGWHRFSRSVGQRAAWERMSPDETDRVLREAEELLAPATRATGEIVVWQDVRYTLGAAR